MAMDDAAMRTDFAVATAGAAAALAGLLFVAVSINLEAVLSGPTIPGRAAEALILLATPIFIALAVLVPGQPAAALGSELVVIGAATGLWLGWLARPSRRAQEQPVEAWLLSLVLPAAALSLGTAMAGLGLLTDALGGLYWLPGAVAFGLLGGLLNAWALLVEIRR